MLDLCSFLWLVSIILRVIVGLGVVTIVVMWILLIFKLQVLLKLVLQSYTVRSKSACRNKNSLLLLWVT